jgi:hypothetical protein
MSKWFVLSVACVLLPATAARAQDEIIKDFSAKQVEKFITDVMKATPKADKISDTLSIYMTPDGQYDLALNTAANKKALIFRYPFKDIKVTPKQLNEWNAREGNQTRLFISKEGQTVLTATLSLEAGLSFKQLTSFYSAIQKEREDFIELVKTQNAARERSPEERLTQTATVSARR